MENINRLIDGFCEQSRTTIERHLDRLAENYAVYSEHLKGISPYLENNDIYVYVHNECIVVVCIDDCNYLNELADTECFGFEAPHFFTEDSSRISPAWLLGESIRLMKIKLREAHIDRFAFWGVLLTQSTIVNADDIKEAWEEQDITVIDNLKGLKKWKIGVNTDKDLFFGTHIMEAVESIVKRPDPTTTEESEVSEADSILQELIDSFVNSPTSEVAEPDEDISATDSVDAAANSDESDNSDYSEDSDASEDSDYSDYSDTSDYSDGELEPDFSIPALEDLPNDFKSKVTILRPMLNPRAELDKLVGCKDIKERIDELLALNRYNAMVHAAFPAAKTHNVSLHSIFLGRPGTGKTTVCKIFGSLLHEAGALSKGHVVVANRSTFVGTHWGDEESNVRNALELAKGGVLMIDEAYLLVSKHEQDPGRMVLQLLMEVLADEKQRDIAVVLCGYKEPMMRLLETNQGLESRFPNRFEFNDFTVDELIEITSRRIGEYQYSFTEPAWQKFKNVLEAAYKERDPQSWGNARFVANQLERIYIEHAQRCVRESPADSNQLLQLTPEDIKPIAVPHQRPHIGFN